MIEDVVSVYPSVWEAIPALNSVDLGEWEVTGQNRDVKYSAAFRTGHGIVHSELAVLVGDPRMATPQQVRDMAIAARNLEVALRENIDGIMTGQCHWGHTYRSAWMAQ